jgi:Rab3 GTPase-activating protein catalytic subunit
LGGLNRESWTLVKNEVLFEVSPDQDDSKRSSWVLAGSPDGRSCKSNLTSLATGEPIWVPVTQDPVQLTEDGLISLQTQLVELGTTKEGARLRAKLQCENLRSGMN